MKPNLNKPEQKNRRLDPPNSRTNAQGLERLRPKQKRILIALAMLNLIALIGLIYLVGRPSTHLSPPTPQPSVSAIDLKTCPADSVADETWEATRQMAELSLNGGVALDTSGVLHFEIVHLLSQPASSPVTSATLDEAAQSAWLAFDAAQALLDRHGDCSPFTDVEVTILVLDEQPQAQLDFHVRAADLLAFHVGELSEEAFIDRVTYTAHSTLSP